MTRVSRAAGVLILYPSLLMLSSVILAGVLRKSIVDKQVVGRLTPYLEEVHVMYFALAVLFALTYTVVPLLVAFCAALALNEPMNLKNPRLQHQRLAGLPGRLYSAQQNLAEGFPGFLAAIFSATFCKVSPTIRVQLACFYVICRLFFVLFYAVGAELLRGTAWMLGIVTCYALFGFAIVPGFGGYVESFGDRVAQYVQNLPLESLLGRLRK